MAETRNISEPFILFNLGSTFYGVRSQVVQQLEMVEHITPVPDVPPFVEGIVLSRGQVIPAINLRVRFGFDKIPYDLRARLVIIHNDERTVGLIVDTAREFVDISSDTIQPPPETISGLSGRYLEGVATLDNKLILILNVEEVLNLVDVVEAIEEYQDLE
ncbi:MAG: purine-binding chemotaxis protein CheW [Chloroflexi bacterium]|nr:purine-binding chemotaxis protein CheW [Chloroflexota bacterium]